MNETGGSALRFVMLLHEAWRLAILGSLTRVLKSPLYLPAVLRRKLGLSFSPLPPTKVQSAVTSWQHRPGVAASVDAFWSSVWYLLMLKDPSKCIEMLLDQIHFLKGVEL